MSKKLFLILLCSISLNLMLPLRAQTNPKPFVIPELKSWNGSNGYFTITEQTKLVYPKDDINLERIAHLLSDDYYTMFDVRLQVLPGKAGKQDIWLALKPDKKSDKEAYAIDIRDGIKITAPEPIGIYWATRTLLQMTEQSADKTLPRGEINDYPDYAMRGFMLDCGSKYIPIQFLRDYVKFMAYYKMNTFHIHLNDNGFKQFFQDDWTRTYSGFRLESEKFPGLASQDGFYTKKEFTDLQILAENLFVEIIPEIDVPAHSLAFSLYKPEIGSKEYGLDHLDLFAPETYTFLDALFAEYLEGENPVFRGPKVHIGTDEYSNEKKEVIEKFRYFTDHYIKYIQSFGKQACVWGALTHAQGDTPVTSDNVLMWLWSNGFSNPDDMMKQGYQLVSIPDGWVYMVPNAGYYHDFLNTKKLYEEWTPARIADKTYPEKHPGIVGGMFALWNDHAGNGISLKDIHYRILPSMKTLATKMWTGANPTIPFDQFDVLKENISEAPGLNIAAKVGNSPAKVLQKDNLTANELTGLTEIGSSYTVTFHLDGKAEEMNTALFTSPNAVFYLSDPIKGMIGFARDGYLNTYNYSMKNGENVEVMICGDLKTTRIYVDGKRIAGHQPSIIFTKNSDSGINYIETLVFPLEKAGRFASRIKNLSVYNYCLDKEI